MSEAAQISRDQVKDFLKNMSLMEAATLVKELETELGVSAAAPVAVAAAGPAAGAAAPAPEKDEFTVMLTGSGEKKIQVIKVVRELTGLGLLVDCGPGHLVGAITGEYDLGIARKTQNVARNHCASAA